ncbi:hypothetical protein OS347_000725 [Vibrio vulnificus]|nr:hypothetical protein [Vibrio vulnificus]
MTVQKILSILNDHFEYENYNLYEAVSNLDIELDVFKTALKHFETHQDSLELHGDMCDVVVELAYATNVLDESERHIYDEYYTEMDALREIYPNEHYA